jgi:hypothetical protein
MEDVYDEQARDRIREAFVAAFKIVHCGEKPKRRKRIIRELLARAPDEFGKLVDIASHCHRN